MKRNKKIYIYVAGPISHGNQMENCRHLINYSQQLFELGLVPFNPGLSCYWHIIFHNEYEKWLEWDFAWIEKCDCLLATRMDVPSQGRDREIEYAKKLGIPVFYGVDEVDTFYKFSKE